MRNGQTTEIHSGGSAEESHQTTKQYQLFRTGNGEIFHLKTTRCNLAMGPGMRLRSATETLRINTQESRYSGWAPDILIQVIDAMDKYHHYGKMAFQRELTQVPHGFTRLGVPVSERPSL